MELNSHEELITPVNRFPQSDRSSEGSANTGWDNSASQ
jgi:hypothetical protein